MLKSYGKGSNGACKEVVFIGKVFVHEEYLLKIKVCD